MEWYCVRHGERIGPLSKEMLTVMIRDGRLGRKDLVWCEAFGETWREAGDVAELHGAPVAPPLPESGDGVGGAAPGAADAGGVSILLASGRAWGRMKAMLFSPFNAVRWFSIGFCAWLADLTGGCSGGRMNLPMGNRAGSGGSGSGGVDLKELAANTQEFIAEHAEMLKMVLSIGITVILVGIVLGVVIAWLGAHGDFMLVHRVFSPDDTIGNAWHAGDGLAGSLFLWRLGVGILFLLLWGLLATGGVFSVLLPCVVAGQFGPQFIGWITLWVALGLALAVVGWAIVRLADDFVVPVMYLRRIRIREAWGVVFELCQEHAGAVVRYCLWYLLMDFAIGVAVLLLIAATCCTLAIPLAIPYLGTVFMLPAVLFLRLLGIEFLALARPQLFEERTPATSGAA